MSKMPSAAYAADAGAEDTGFTFPLPTVVEGLNARGKEFAEDTVLSSINYEGSSFILKNSIQIGTRLRLAIDLPEKLSNNDKALKLVIKGHVTKIETYRERTSAQRVWIIFDSKYIIRPEA